MEAEPKAPKRRRNTKSETIIENASMRQENEREIKVEVSKYSALDSILGSNKKTVRVLGLLFFTAVFLFFVIFVITISLKKIYSYSDITTNALGATTITSEKSEVSYWLYNTSQLWANSGISVKKGDIITVRSSGKFMTAIHHLYDDSKENTKPNDAWVGTEGEKDNPDPESSTYLRRRFRIFPNLPTGALVMQVVDNESYDSQYDVEEDSQKQNFYLIGKERENIKIAQNGTLYFALNDIVLNERTIKGMLQTELQEELEKSGLKEPSVDALFAEFNKKFGSSIRGTNPIERKLGRLKTGVTTIKVKDSKNKLNIDPTKVKDAVETQYKTAVLEGNTVKMSELEYYYRMRYKTAWYDDNLGSFLIVVEKNPSK